MGKQRKDILQIRKYLNGELDARAMHELERQAQDDPFLMEALEGYENAKPTQQENLDDLSARLQQRIEKKSGRIISWGFISVAASVLIVLTIGGIWLMKRQPAQQIRTARADIAAPRPKKYTDTIPPMQPQNAVLAPAKSAPFAAYNKKTRDTNTEMAASVNDNAVSENMISSEPPVSEAETPKPAASMAKDKASSSLNEVVATGYAAQKKAVADSTKVNTYQYKSADQALQGRAAGVQVSPNRYAGRATITGIVTAFDGGQPIPGAVVKVEGQKFGVVTDVNGRFTLPKTPNNATLAVSFIGYDPQQVNVVNKDSLKIALKPSGQSLSEVVAVGYGNKKADDNDTEFISAHPKEGWGVLSKHLKEKAVLPDGTKGKVRLSFIVDGSGNLSSFQVIKSLNKDADSKAVSLIENGPDWVGASDGKPQKVKVTVNFH